MVIFYCLRNIADTNGFIIYCKNGNEPMQRRKFLKKLCLELCDDYVKKRASIVTLSKQLRQKLTKVTNTEVQNELPKVAYKHFVMIVRVETERLNTSVPSTTSICA